MAELPDEIIEQHKLGFKLVGFLRSIFERSLDGPLRGKWEISCGPCMVITVDNVEANVRGSVSVHLADFDTYQLTRQGEIDFSALDESRQTASEIFVWLNHPDNVSFTLTAKCVEAITPIWEEVIRSHRQQCQDRIDGSVARITSFFAALTTD